MKTPAKVLLLLWAVAMPAAAEAQKPSHLEQSASEVIEATLSYRAALERVLAIYE